MNWHWQIRWSWNAAIVFATFAGPCFAVLATEWQRKRADARNRKIHVFRTLMATRAANLAVAHIESLNLVELEFGTSNKKKDRAVVDAWKLYKSHLAAQRTSLDVWMGRKRDLLVDLLYSMSVALGYPFAKSDINTDAYYPAGYATADVEFQRTRQLWLEVLEGKRQVPMKAEVYGSPPPGGDSSPPPAAPAS